MGRTVNPLAKAYEGSNPSLPTRLLELLGIWESLFENNFRHSKHAEEPVYFKRNQNKQAGVAQLVEHQPSKLRVASPSLVSRSKR